jgi:hypothetical protein
VPASPIDLSALSPATDRCHSGCCRDGSPFRSLHDAARRIRGLGTVGIG